MISKNDYMKNPCGLTSIPYWKCKAISVPPNIKIVHSDNFCKMNYQNYIDEQYFRLFHSLKEIKAVSLNNSEIVTCASDNIDIFVKLINESYDDLTVTPPQLQSFCKTPVYCPELWLYLKDKNSGKIIGGIICDFDKEIGEVIIEWLQVLPEYRNCGYGQILVNSALSRAKVKAKFATVSGKVNNPSKPEIFYRKCGFTGNDIWHVLTKI